MRKSVDIKDWSRNVVMIVLCARVSEGSDLGCSFAMTPSGNSFQASGKKQKSGTHDWITDEAHVRVFVPGSRVQYRLDVSQAARFNKRRAKTLLGVA